MPAIKILPLIIIMFTHYIHSQENVENYYQDSSSTQTIALNPIFAPLGTITIEYERTFLKEDLSFGISGWYEYKDVRARWIYLKGMYYIGGKSLRGFAFGVTIGMIRWYREKNAVNQLQEDTTPIVGAMIQNNWYIGEDDNILIGIGFGSRVALKQSSTNSPLHKFDGDVRLVMGILI